MRVHKLCGMHGPWPCNFNPEHCGRWLAPSLMPAASAGVTAARKVHRPGGGELRSFRHCGRRKCVFPNDCPEDLNNDGLIWWQTSCCCCLTSLLDECDADLNDDGATNVNDICKSLPRSVKVLMPI